MKHIRSKGGPFSERPHFKLREIEQICTEELTKVDLYPSSPQPIRIDRFIEKRFKVAPEYQDLPAGVLGFTKFGPKGVEAIVIAKATVVKKRLWSAGFDQHLRTREATVFSTRTYSTWAKSQNRCLTMRT